MFNITLLQCCDWWWPVPSLCILRTGRIITRGRKPEKMEISKVAPLVLLVLLIKAVSVSANVKVLVGPGGAFNFDSDAYRNFLFRLLAQIPSTRDLVRGRLSETADEEVLHAYFSDASTKSLPLASESALLHSFEFKGEGENLRLVDDLNGLLCHLCSIPQLSAHPKKTAKGTHQTKPRLDVEFTDDMHKQRFRSQRLLFITTEADRIPRSPIITVSRHYFTPATANINNSDVVVDYEINCTENKVPLLVKEFVRDARVVHWRDFAHVFAGLLVWLGCMVGIAALVYRYKTANNSGAGGSFEGGSKETTTTTFNKKKNLER